jgi:uncharacterized protein (TIGR02001 family)
VIAVSATTGFAADLSYKDTPVVGDQFAWTGYVQATSDYVFRGLSQNRREPAAQGGLDATYGMFYIGTFASSVNFDAPGAPNTLDTRTEIDVYGGIKPKVGDVTFDLGVISYNYPNVHVDHALGLYDTNYVEFKVGASGTVLKDIAWTGTVFVSPDYLGETGTTVVVEGSLSKPLFKYREVDFSASATVGYLDYTDQSVIPGTIAPLNSYAYYNAGVTATYKAFSLDVRWWDTSLNDTSAQCSFNQANQCGSTLSVTAKVTF